MISVIKAYLSQIQSGHQKTLKPLKYDRNLKRFVHKSGNDMQRTTGVDIAFGCENHSVINKTVSSPVWLTYGLVCVARVLDY